MDKFFKKPSGMIFKAEPQHDLQSLKDRFEECDQNGNKIKKAVKKVAKKAKKEGK